MNIDDNVPIPRLIDVPTVCAITSLSVSRIYALIAEGELRRVKIGRKALFVEAEIRTWLEGKIAASPRHRLIPKMETPAAMVSNRARGGGREPLTDA